MAKHKRHFLPLLLPITPGLLVILPWAGFTAEYHTGDTLLCFDCHTMHFSETQGFSPTDPYGTGIPIQFPLTTGPNPYLIRQPQNNICLSCHDGQTSAPDVLGVNVNASPVNGREAGALNDLTGAAPYNTWKGHTLYSTAIPPGYNPSLVGLSDWYSGTTYGLKCIHCHEFHGSPLPYRNLGASALGPIVASFQPTYVISTSTTTTADVRINIPAGYVAGTGNPATFNPYYATANIFFNRNDTTVGSVKTSNRMGTFCATCHATFHGGGGNANIGGTVSGSGYEEFLRHPTAQTTIGSLGGGHSSLTRYLAATTKTKVTSSDSGTNGTNGTFTDASPFCLSCHKTHGNQNPFGLIFLNRNAASVDEQGGYAGGQTQDTATGYRNLCGQCHGQGN
jgi:hypothetical protein